jgi:hypothetical protein
MTPRVSASYKINKGALARVKGKLQAKTKAMRVLQHDVKVGINSDNGSKKIIKYTGEEGEETLAYVALAHEFGAGVPMRSWFRTWFDTNAERNRKQMATALRAEAKGDSQAVILLAIRWAYEMRARISTSSADFRPLAPSTKRQRIRAGLAEGPPLHAIGQIVEAIRAIVDDKVVGP